MGARVLSGGRRYFRDKDTSEGKQHTVVRECGRRTDYCAGVLPLEPVCERGGGAAGARLLRWPWIAFSAAVTRCALDFGVASVRRLLAGISENLVDEITRNILILVLVDVDMGVDVGGRDAAIIELGRELQHHRQH